MSERALVVAGGVEKALVVAHVVHVSSNVGILAVVFWQARRRLE